MVHDFMIQLDDKLKSKLVGDERKLFPCGEDKLRTDISLKLLKTSSMVYYSRVFESIHDNMNMLIYEYNHNEYVVADLYCPNPLCKCTEVLLEFYKINNNNHVENSVADIFYDYKTNLHRINKVKRGISEQDAEEIYQAFIDYYAGDWKSFFKERYKNIKRWRLGSYEKKTEKSSKSEDSEYSSQKKIGRNEPCPCGSGKKYKRCCGLGK
jgi:hypothetical protein